MYLYLLHRAFYQESNGIQSFTILEMNLVRKLLDVAYRFHIYSVQSKNAIPATKHNSVRGSPTSNSNSAGIKHTAVDLVALCCRCLMKFQFTP